MEGGAAGELCERIAWMLDPEAFKIWERDHVARAGSEPRGPTWDQLAVTGRRGAARKMAASLVAGPLAGRLIDPTTQSEAVASARAEGVREGLERAADEVQHLARSPRTAGIPCDTNTALANSADTLATAIRALIPAPPTLTPGGRTDG
jgi:hypothetical protein